MLYNSRGYLHDWQVQGPEDLSSLFLELKVGFFGSAPATSGAKLMALDALWRYWTEGQKPNRAAEVRRMAIESPEKHLKAT